MIDEVVIYNTALLPSEVLSTQLSVDEHSPAGTVVGTVSEFDTDLGDSVSLTLEDDANGLFQLIGSELQVAGWLDYAASTSHNITIRATDNGGLFTEVTLTIQINNINDPPVAGMAVNVLEDTSIQITLTATDIDGNTKFTFTITGQPQHGRLSGDVSNLTYHPALDFEGTDSFTYIANDGELDSEEGTVTIDVLGINDPPTFQLSKTEVHIPNDAGQQSLNNIINAISPGSIYEVTGQSVWFSVENNMNGLFTDQPVVDATGVLYLTPNSNSVGTAEVSIALNDDGGTANGGMNASATKTFYINVESSSARLLL